MTRGNHPSLAWLLAAIAALALAAPAGAKVVEFTATFKAGLGDGGDPPLTPSSEPNGLPLCNKGLITHLNASAPAHGFVEVASGPAPQSIMDFRPYKYGTAGATGPSPTFSMPGVAGVNGGPLYVSSTCMLAFQSASLPMILNARAQSSRFSWPANYTFFLSSNVMTIMASGTMPGPTPTVSRNVVGTQLETHHLAAGRGPGNFSVSVDAGITQFLSNVAGTNTFGGGFRASGGGRVNLGVNLGSVLTAQGYWLSGPRLVGHNRTGLPSTAPVSQRITQKATQSGTFTTNMFGGMIPAKLEVWNMPFSTGMAHVEDHGGSFTTIRNITGYDNRTTMGELGTLLLVSPWTANISGVGLIFGGTADLKFEFLPEPGPTALFAAGVLGIFVLHFAARRRK